MAGKISRYIPPHVFNALLARSGNKCAYPGCPAPVVDTQHRYVAQLCHIESVLHKKQRYNPQLSAESLNGYDNLMFLCYKHHVETNDEKVFTVAVMKKMKYDHEQEYVQNPYTVDQSHLFELKHQIEEFWSRAESVYTNDPSDFNFIIDTKANYIDLNEAISRSLSLLEDLLDSLSPEDKNKYWEIFNLGVPNHISSIKLLQDQMILKYLETYTLSHPSDMAAKAQLDKLRENFLYNLTHSKLVD